MRIIPQFFIHNVIETGINFITQEYESAVNKQESLIAEILGDTNFRGLSLKNELVAVLLPSSERKVNVVLGYSTEKQGVPTIHCTVGSISDSASSIGMMGSRREIPISNSTKVRIAGWKTRSVSLLLYITSSNIVEIIGLDEIVSFILGSIQDKVGVLGISEFKFSSQDLMQHDEVVPGLFHRAVNISFNVETETLSSQELTSTLISLITTLRQ